MTKHDQNNRKTLDHLYSIWSAGNKNPMHEVCITHIDTLRKATAMVTKKKQIS